MTTQCLCTDRNVVATDRISRERTSTEQAYRNARVAQREISTGNTTANSIIDVDLDAGVATARSAYVVFMATPDFPLQATGAGRYHDRFGRGPDGWHFTERLFIQELHGDLSAHTKPPEI